MSEKPIEKIFCCESKISLTLNKFRKNEKFCDYILKSSDGESFSVHKNVIAAASSFFEAKFNNPLYADSDSNSTELQNVSYEVLGRIIDFMYTAQTTIHPDYAKEMLDTALFLGLENLVNGCTEVLVESINLDNCLDLLYYSDTYHCSESLDKKCREFISENIDSIMETSEFENISFDVLQKIISIERNGCSEEFIYLAVVKWISFDFENREKYIRLLLDAIHFEQLTQEFCSSNIFENNPLLDNVVFLKKMFDIQKCNVKMNIANEQGKKPILLSESKKMIVKKTQLYEHPEGCEIFNVFNGTINLLNIDSKNNFKSITSINCTDFGYANLKDDFFISGGFLNNEKTNLCQYFSFNKNTWNELSSLKIARSHHRAVSSNDQIYICGGLNENSVEIFDINHNCWMDGPALPESMSTFGLCVLNNNCIYSTYDTNLYYLDIRENTWNKLSENLNSMYPWCTSIGIENYIYRFDYEYIYTFDLRNNKWIDEEMKIYENIYEQIPHSCIFNNEIYLSGYCYQLGINKNLLQKYNVLDMNIAKNYYFDTTGDSYIQGIFCGAE